MTGSHVSLDRLDRLIVPALTVRQPYASLLALGIKRNETRGWRWRTPGALAIHASTSTAGWGRASTWRRRAVRQFGPYEVEKDGPHGLLLRGPGLAWPYRLPLGQVVAVLSVCDIKRTDSLELVPDDVERALGDYATGRFAWQTGSLSPITRPDSTTAAKGRLGLWPWALPGGLNERLLYPLTPGRDGVL